MTWQRFSHDPVNLPPALQVAMVVGIVISIVSWFVSLFVHPPSPPPYVETWADEVGRPWLLAQPLPPDDSCYTPD